MERGSKLTTEQLLKNEKREENIEEMSDNGALITFGKDGEIIITATQEQKDEARKEMEESITFAKKYRDKIGKKVHIIFNALDFDLDRNPNPSLFEGVPFLAEFLLSPVYVREKRIETVLKDISNGEATFNYEGNEIKIDTALIKDVLS